MNDTEKLMRDITAVQDEFGLSFQVTNPDEVVTTEQRTINNLFFALLEARRERNYWKSIADDPGAYWNDPNPPYRLDHEEETAEHGGT